MTWRKLRPVDASDAAWRGFVVRFIAVLLGALAGTLGFIVLIDPYDSGRFPALGIVGAAERNQRTANVSLGRSQEFNAAIIGNSHGQLLDPERLSRATDLSFVQLTIPGANAPEQIATLRWFIRHHSRIGAIVVAADNRWCAGDPQPWQWFPFWLYADGDLQYLWNALNSRTIGAAVRRIEHALHLLRPSNPRGYDDYEIGISADHRFDFPMPARPAIDLTASSVGLGNWSFPAIDRLAAELAAVPAETPVVVLFPPIYYSTFPDNADLLAQLRACKARFARVAAAPRRGYLDFFVDSPMARDPDNFHDFEHYRAHIARGIEAEIARILSARMSAARAR